MRDGRAVGFHGDPDHPFTRGWLCAKVRPYLDRVYSPDRLQYPLRRVGAKGSGEWARISWDEAIGEIAERWQAIIAEHGAAAILPYSFSGTLGLLQGGVASIRLWNRMGVSGLERSICGAAAETAVKMTLGGRLAPDARDVRHSRLIVIWGHNPASTSPHFMPFMRDAQRDGAYVVVIDPRRSTTARSADEHLRPRPATDGALALGLMHVLFAEGLHDEAWLRQHSVGWEDLRQRVHGVPTAASRRDHRHSGGADRGAGSPVWHDKTGPAEVCRRHPAAWQRRPDVSRARLAAGRRRADRRARWRALLLHLGLCLLARRGSQPSL